MTSIKLTATGAKARAVVAGLLTSGMIGIPVTIEYDDSWENLTKNLVCMCREDVRDPGVTRSILNVGHSAVVAHEVMLPGRELYLGIEGRSADGKLVVPTTWAYCGKILSGTNADADPSASPKLSIWGQLQTEINQLKAQPITEAQIAAGVEAYFEENPIEVPETPTSSALNTAQITALDNIFKVCAFTKGDVSAEYNAFKTAFGITDSEDEEPDVPVVPDEPEVTLSSISATYSGGDVAAGTAVSDLTGIVVTAHYSDGTSQTVTGYTLSGEIAGGSNTVTVTYQDKTATFTVNGIAESGGEESAGWEDGVPYVLTIAESGKYVVIGDGTLDAAANYSVTDFLPCHGASQITLDNDVYWGNYNAFYDENKAYVKALTFPATVPENAWYIRLSSITSNFAAAVITPHA